MLGLTIKSNSLFKTRTSYKRENIKVDKIRLNNTKIFKYVDYCVIIE